MRKREAEAINVPNNPPREDPDDEVLTLAEAAAFLRISERTLYPLAAAGKVPCIRVRRQYRFVRGRLKEWMREGGSR